MNEYSKNKAYTLFLNYINSPDYNTEINDNHLNIIKRYCDLGNSVSDELVNLKFDSDYYNNLEKLQTTFTYKKIAEALTKVNLESDDWFYQCVIYILDNFNSRVKKVVNVVNTEDLEPIKKKEINSKYLTELLDISNQEDIISEEEYERLKDFGELESFKDRVVTVDNVEYNYMDLPTSNLINGVEHCPYSGSDDLYVCCEDPKLLASFDAEKPFRSIFDY